MSADEDPEFPGEQCPRCGSEEREWKNIVGDAARPQGSIYECVDCGREYDTLPTERWRLWPAQGTRP